MIPTTLADRMRDVGLLEWARRAGLVRDDDVLVLGFCFRRLAVSR